MIQYLTSLLLIAAVVHAGDSDWCGAGTNKCSTSGSTLSNLACGWCRSWTFATNIAGNSLRMIGVDGGALPGDGSSSNNYLISASLTTGFDLSNGAAWTLTSIPTVVPNIRDGAFWASQDNSSIWAFGGRSPSTTNIPVSGELPRVALSNQTWTLPVGDVTVGRLTAGADVDVPQLQTAYYLGGYQSSSTSQGITDGNLHFASNIVAFNTTTGNPNTFSAPFLPVQHGAATYLPYGKSGILVFFGGETPSSSVIKDCSNCVVNTWDHVWVYDIAGLQWHRQNTTGYAEPRSEFCISSIYDQQSSSWQIWTMGGVDLSSDTVLNTVSVLSIPSFQWYNASSGTTRMSVSCQTVGSQVFVVGGRTANTNTGGSGYDALAYIYDVNKQKVSSSYDPTKTTYTAPASIASAMSTPATWGDSSLKGLFVNTPATASTTTSTSSTSTTSSTATAAPSSGVSTGAIAGIVVGVVMLLAVIAILAFLLWRRRRANSASSYVYESSEPLQPNVPLTADRKEGPAELAAVSQTHQLPSGHERWEMDGRAAAEMDAQAEKSHINRSVHELH